MVSDLDAAAPLIDAVFGTAPAERHIPYLITGRARRQVNAPARVLLDLLALLGSRFGISEVFALLQQPPVARRFGLDDDALQRLHDWLLDAGAHWALDAGQRAALNLPAEPRHTLADAFDRLLLGYALPAHATQPFDGRLPAGGVEGTAALALGGLADFLAALTALRDTVAAVPRARDWPALLAGALADFVAARGDEVDELHEVQFALDTLASPWRQAAPDLPLPLAVVQAALGAALDDAALGGVAGGAVNFASMSSLRGLPFTVVCALGLNDGAFPSAARPLEFDLMALKPRPGDRQRRHDERNLFLDLLLAARACVHLSYTGRSVRDNAVLPPSVLVAELLDVLQPAVTGQADAARAAGHRTPAAGVLRTCVPHRCRPARAQPPARLRSGAEGGTRTDAGAAGARRRRGRRRGRRRRQRVPGRAAGRARCRLARCVAGPAGSVSCATRAATCSNAGSASSCAATRTNSATTRPSWPTCRRAARWRCGCCPRCSTAPTTIRCARSRIAGTELPAGAFGRHTLERELAALRHFATPLAAALREPCLPAQAVSVEVDLDGQPWRVAARVRRTCARAGCSVTATTSCVPATTSTPGCST